MYHILVYFGSELFSQNCSKIPFVISPRGQSIGHDRCGMATLSQNYFLWQSRKMWNSWKCFAAIINWYTCHNNIVDFVVHLHVNIKCVNTCTWLSLLTLHVHVHFYRCTIPLCTYTRSHTNTSILLCVNIKVCDPPQLLVTWLSHDRHMTQCTIP